MINPGHGGHDSDDRGQPNGFWESEGNLTKGLWLRDLLEARGCEVVMSRVLNRTEDDLPLSQIAAMANQNEVDLFISIHSNAANQVSNFPLTIFNGKSETPAIPEAKVWAQILWEQLITNKATHWTSTTPHYIGDLTLNPTFTYGYGVLYPLEVPGIISEGSFHDYLPEMDRLLNLEYRKQEAWNIYYAMLTYFELSGSENFGQITGIIRDTLLAKPTYTLPNSADKFEVVNNAQVKIIETGDIYQVDAFNTGFYYFDSLPPGTYHLVFSADKYFNDTVPLTVEAHKFTYHNHWLEADKTMPPKVLYATPEANSTINCNDPISLTFSMNMDTASVTTAFSLEPATDGTFTWDESMMIVSFQPLEPYATQTTYTVLLDNTASHQWGVSLENDFTFEFFTGDRNRYSVEKTYPVENQTEISPYLQFRLVFDAPLNNSSLIGAVTIEASDGTQIGTKSASITTIDNKGHYYFKPDTDLDFATNYTLNLSGSIKDVNNIPLVEEQTIPFTTMQTIGELSVFDEMEDENFWSLDKDNSTGLDASSFLKKWTKEYRLGAGSLILRYLFTANDANIQVKPVDPIPLIDEMRYLGLWVWGDLSSHPINLKFDNEAVLSLGIIDFAGWNYCYAEVPQGATALVGIEIVRGSESTNKGEIYLDALSQMTPVSVISAAGSMLKVYPNPVIDGRVMVDGLPAEQSVTYQIADFAGRKLQQGKLHTNQAGSAIIEIDSNPGNSVLLLTISYKEYRFTKLLNH
jgi:N-acetylmuramoyl-L-alanine amidase